jgi:hypothetical protein
MVRYTLHVPCADNDGRSLDDLHQRVEAWLVAEFGGFTRTDAIAVAVDRNMRDKAGKVATRPRYQQDAFYPDKITFVRMNDLVRWEAA